MRAMCDKWGAIGDKWGKDGCCCGTGAIDYAPELERVRAALGNDTKSVCVMYGTEGAMTCAARNMARANECTKDKNECAKCTDKCEDAKDSEDCKKACGTVECAPKCTPKANKCDEVTCPPVKKTLR